MKPQPSNVMPWLPQPSRVKKSCSHSTRAQQCKAPAFPGSPSHLSSAVWYKDAASPAILATLHSIAMLPCAALPQLTLVMFLIFLLTRHAYPGSFERAVGHVMPFFRGLTMKPPNAILEKSPPVTISCLAKGQDDQPGQQ